MSDKEFVKQQSMTLCWCCSRAVGHCSWSANLIPVKGWVAKPVVKQTTTSYIVMQCPLFDRDSTNYGLRRLPREKENTYNNIDINSYCD